MCRARVGVWRRMTVCTQSTTPASPPPVTTRSCSTSPACTGINNTHSRVMLMLILILSCNPPSYCLYLEEPPDPDCRGQLLCADLPRGRRVRSPGQGLLLPHGLPARPLLQHPRGPAPGHTVMAVNVRIKFSIYNISYTQGFCDDTNECLPGYDQLRR